MKTIELTINIDELDIDYRSIPEQRQDLETEGIPAHIEINYIKLRGVDISDLVDESEIVEYLQEQSNDY